MKAPPGRRGILMASTTALAVAAALLLTLILPAEYGWDPLGTGRALGLTGLTQDQTTALRRHARHWREDSITLPLAPFESVEYKYRLEAGAVILYRWRVDGEVVYDMHAEPDGTAPGYAESFARSRGRADSGSYTAPFAGLHGWFWQNRSGQPVVVQLEARGFFESAVELRDGRVFEYESGTDAQQ